MTLNRLKLLHKRWLLLPLLALVLSACGSSSGTNLTEIATRAAATATAAAESLASVETELPAYCDQHPDRCLVKGSDDAPVKIYEVSDHMCPHCSTFNQQVRPSLDALFVDSGQAQVTVLPSAIIFDSADSAIGTLCAMEQDRGEDYHDALFVAQKSTPLTANELRDIATSLGLDEAEFRRCLNDSSKRVAVNETNQFVIGLGANSTPTVWVNGEKVSPDLASIQEAIAFETGQ